MTLINRLIKFSPLTFGSLIAVTLLLITTNIATANTGEANPPPKKPNFVWLVSEDNSAEFLRLYNQNDSDGFGAIMPNVEKLAANGLIFNSAFSNAPVCSTARTTLATGAYGPRIGTQFHRPYKLPTMPENVKAIGQLMQEAGYYTSNNAKTDFNFLEATATTVWNDTSNTASWHGRQAQQPFFHMQSWNDTHEHKLHFSETDIKTQKTHHTVNNMDKFPIYPNTETFRYTLAKSLDNHQIIDEKIGLVIKQLEDDGLIEDTFIFYFGDHGGVMPASKGYIFERGLHVPLVVRVPKNFKHLLSRDMQEASNTRLDGVVNFIDFAPTLLKLAGIKASPQHDGLAFLGNDISKKVLAKRDYSFSYADRFDEKYDLLRSIRKGNLKYIRSYQPYYADGMFSNYRYKQAAYNEWKALFEQGKLPDNQSAFFRPKPVERLFDISSDPHEIKNISSHPDYQKDLKVLRELLNTQLKSMPDLSFYPEAFLVENAMDDPVRFGQQHKAEIAKLIDIANMQLQPFNLVKKSLTQLLKSPDEWQRYWALIVLSSFAEQANSFESDVSTLLKNEDNVLVTARAIEFLTTIKRIDPVTPLSDLFSHTQNDIELLELLNIATYLKEYADVTFPTTLRTKRHKKLAVSNYGNKNMDTWLEDRWQYISQ